MSSPTKPNPNLAALVANHRNPRRGRGWKRRRRVVILQGSSRSGKTWSIVEYIINCCLSKKHLVARSFRHDSTTCDDSIVADFHSIMQAKGWWELGSWNKQRKSFSFSNGSTYSFGATSDPQKLHGPAQDIAHCNEIMEITADAWDQLQMRTRFLMIGDFNPTISNHFVFSRYDRPEHRGEDGDVLWLTTTYKDNPHLSPEQVAGIEQFNPNDPANASTADKWKWEVYGLGKPSRRTGAVYDNWHIRPPSEFPKREAAQAHGYGLDFGATNPTALIECWLWDGALWLRELVYESDLSLIDDPQHPNSKNLESRMASARISRSDLIVADSANAMQILELARRGWRVTKALKPADSLLAGIALARSMPIYVDESSSNLIREFEQYVWRSRPRLHKELGELSKFEDSPHKANDHAMDAFRYWLQFCHRSLPVVSPHDPRGAEPVESRRVSSPFGGRYG